MKLLVVAGEASADLHAAHLVGRLRGLLGTEPLTLVGIGGDALEREGLRPVQHARDMAVVGFTEALRKIPQTLRLLGGLEELARAERPDAALLLDLPDFNLRLAPRLKRAGVPVIYYISPQVWAWRSGRVHAMAECIDRLLTILPFEKGWYERHAPAKLRVDYVGHPVLEEIPELPYAPEEGRVALLPGSRESEWRNLFGPMIGAAGLLGRGNAELRFELPLAEPLRGNEVVRELLSPRGPHGNELASLGDRFRVREVPAHEVLRRSKAAWIASGTATLEAAIVGVPMVVAYKVSPTTAFLFKHLVKYQGAVAMANLIHGGLGSADRAVPELLQDDVTPQGLAGGMRELLAEPRWTATRDRLARTRELLRGTGLPVENAARAVAEFVRARREAGEGRAP